MTTENAETNENAAAVAETGAHVAPEKAFSKKSATKMQGAPKAKKTAKGAKPKATAKKAAKAAKKATPAKADGVREGSKTATVLALIQRAKGATLVEIMDATGWQAHSVRGFISGTLGKKMGLTVNSEKREDGARVYSIAK